MPVINTNYLSLVAQNNLTKSQNTLGSAIEKLSSGLRINSAKDDAAGQAIANRFTANVKGLTQAARNANDGISIAQTTEGALNEINNNLQRVRELTVQATNGTNSGTDLDSIQAEITQRLDEIDRVSKQTQFNGTSVLSSNQEMKIQVGANDNETISINLKKIDSDSLGLGTFSVNGLTQVNNFKQTDATTKAVTTSPDATFAKTGAAAAADNKFTDPTLFGYGDLDTATGKYDSYVVKDDVGNMYKLDAANVNADTGVVTVDFADAAELTTASDAYKTDVAAGVTGTANPLAALDAALSTVDQLRSDLGAVQNRFQSTVANLNNTVNNLSAARSRIEDADYATEVSNMSKAQILQQAGTSVLAQANQVPQSVLSLLQ